MDPLPRRILLIWVRDEVELKEMNLCQFEDRVGIYQFGDRVS